MFPVKTKGGWREGWGRNISILCSCRGKLAKKIRASTTILGPVSFLPDQRFLGARNQNCNVNAMYRRT
jgi:hypothetical protein